MSATATAPCKTFPEYQAIEAVNWSTLRYALKSAKHYQYCLSNPVEETDAMRLGRATHTAVFEPDRLLMKYTIWEGGRRFGKEWDAFCAANAKRTILQPDDYETAIAIRDAVRGHDEARKLLLDRSGTPEYTLTWTDEETGLECKARLDWLAQALVDLKTTRCIDARAFGRHAADMLYHCQLAFYVGGLAAKGITVPVYIIAVENKPPHDVAVYELDEDVLWAGEVKVREALELVARCRETNEWPGRYQTIQPLQLPAWEFPADELDLADLGLIPAKGGRR